jgi:apolipoprotein N-acyltransferase
MDIEILKIFGQIAGIGGLALVTFLILFRDIISKNIFPTLKKDDAYRLLRLIVILISIITVIGVGVWVWSENNPNKVVNIKAKNGVAAGGDISGNTITINSTDGNTIQSTE